ncbi:glycosyl hydrolase family 61-domain-containing protein [Flagelloscypha sp. PMI_526]|nr:glycosyl hydrolase family 61-domain-containing protein [Flagelloscypha sp. PMI_526]
MRSTSFVAALLLSAVQVYAHGRVDHVEVDGKSYPGWNPYSGSNPNAVTYRPYKNEGADAFNLPNEWTDATKMSCETGDVAPKAVPVNAGGSVTIFSQGATGELKNQPGVGGTPYNPWVHAIGTVSNYITSCGSSCQSFNAAGAGWTRLSADALDMSKSISSGLRQTMKNKPEEYYPKSGNGLWGMAKFVANGSKQTVQIPNLKPGEYLLRQELVALHNPKSNTANSGPQMYVGCVRLKVTGSGDVSLPSGTKSSSFYSPNGALANYNHFTQDITKFKMGGPAVWDGASSGGSSDSGSNDSGSGSSNSGSSNSGSSNSGSSNSGSGSGSNDDNNDTATKPGKCQKRSVKKRRAARAAARGFSKKRLHMKRLIAESF